MPANACWGIEIGAYALKAVKLERDGDQLRIADYAYIPHRKVLSTPDVDADDVTRLTIGSLVSQYDLSHADIAVSVPGHMAFARFAKLPPVEPKKIPDIVRFEAVQQIPFPIDEVVWDFQTFVSESSPDVEVGIFAITNERIEDRLHMWGEMGLDPNVVTISPVAVYNAIAYDEIFSETTPGTIILDIGTTSTDLIIAEEGRTWIRTFPLGGHQFTLELAETFKLNYAKAEKLKREAATSSHKRQILQAMRPIFGDVVSDVQQSIGYYESLHPDCQLTKIIGIGSTFQLPGMRKYLSQQLQMEVVRLDDFKRAKLVDSSDAARFNEHIHNYVTAYGLALQGLGDETIRANLMPTQVLRKQMWRNKTKWFATAAAVSVIASGAMFIRPVLDGQV
ncbi:MAG: type IV pilus assembly protein PilM, partial [Phycisphaerales bacterium JB038]